MRASDKTGIVTQLNKNGSTTLFCNGRMRLVDELPSTKHVEEVNRLRNQNKKSEVDKFVARMKQYGGTVPDSLLQIG